MQHTSNPIDADDGDYAAGNSSISALVSWCSSLHQVPPFDERHGMGVDAGRGGRGGVGRGLGVMQVVCGWEWDAGRVQGVARFLHRHVLHLDCNITVCCAAI